MSNNNYRFKDSQNFYQGENITFGSPQPVFRHQSNLRPKEKDTQKNFINQGSPYPYHLYDNHNVYQPYNVPGQMNMHQYEHFVPVNDNCYNVGFSHDGQFMVGDSKNIQFASGSQRIDPNLFNIPHFDPNQQSYFQDNYYQRAFPPNQNYGSLPAPYSQMTMVSGVQDHQIQRPRGNFQPHRMPRNSPPSPRYSTNLADQAGLSKSRIADDHPISLQQKFQNAIKLPSSGSLVNQKPSTDQLINTLKTQTTVQKPSNDIEFNMTNDEFPTLSESTGVVSTTTPHLSRTKPDVINNNFNKPQVISNEVKSSSIFSSKFPYNIPDITKFFNETESFQVANMPPIPDEKYLMTELLSMKNKSLRFGRKLKDYITNIDSAEYWILCLVCFNSEPIIHQLLMSPCDSRMTHDHLIDFPVPYEYLIYQSIREKTLKFDCSKLSEDVLFYIYYVESGDACQMLAAHNLYLRKWRFYSQDKIWVKIMIPYAAGDSYKFFDICSWQIISKNDPLDITKLEDNQSYLPYIGHDVRIVLSQSAEEDQHIHLDLPKSNSNDDSIISNKNK